MSHVTGGASRDNTYSWTHSRMHLVVRRCACLTCHVWVTRLVCDMMRQRIIRIVFLNAFENAWLINNACPGVMNNTYPWVVYTWLRNEACFGYICIYVYMYSYVTWLMHDDIRDTSHSRDIYIYIYIHIYIYIYFYLYLFIYISISLSIYICS